MTGSVLCRLRAGNFSYHGVMPHTEDISSSLLSFSLALMFFQPFDILLALEVIAYVSCLGLITELSLILTAYSYLPIALTIAANSLCIHYHSLQRFFF